MLSKGQDPPRLALRQFPRRTAQGSPRALPRLSRFRPDGPASLSTWLRAVVRDLCLDWHRQEFGRHRVFESVARLPALDQEIFKLLIRLRFERDLTLEEIARVFGLDNAQTADRRIKEAVERLREGMSQREGRLRKCGREPPPSGPLAGPQ